MTPAIALTGAGGGTEGDAEHGVGAKHSWIGKGLGGAGGADGHETRREGSRKVEAARLMIEFRPKTDQNGL